MAGGRQGLTFFIDEREPASTGSVVKRFFGWRRGRGEHEIFTSDHQPPALVTPQDAERSRAEGPPAPDRPPPEARSVSPFIQDPSGSSPAGSARGQLGPSPQEVAEARRSRSSLRRQEKKLREGWVADKMAKSCYRCRSDFSMFTRRHHCRVCGQIFCWRCSDNFIDGARLGLPESQVRVCDNCNAEVDVRKKMSAQGPRTQHADVVSTMAQGLAQTASMHAEGPRRQPGESRAPSSCGGTPLRLGLPARARTASQTDLAAPQEWPQARANTRSSSLQGKGLAPPGQPTHDPVLRPLAIAAPAAHSDSPSNVGGSGVFSEMSPVREARALRRVRSSGPRDNDLTHSPHLGDRSVYSSVFDSFGARPDVGAGAADDESGDVDDDATVSFLTCAPDLSGVHRRGDAQWRRRVAGEAQRFRQAGSPAVAPSSAAPRDTRAELICCVRDLADCPQLIAQQGDVSNADSREPDKSAEEARESLHRAAHVHLANVVRRLMSDVAESPPRGGGSDAGAARRPASPGASSTASSEGPSLPHYYPNVLTAFQQGARHGLRQPAGPAPRTRLRAHTTIRGGAHAPPPSLHAPMVNQVALEALRHEVSHIMVGDPAGWAHEVAANAASALRDRLYDPADLLLAKDRLVHAVRTRSSNAVEPVTRALLDNPAVRALPETPEESVARAYAQFESEFAAVVARRFCQRRRARSKGGTELVESAFSASEVLDWMCIHFSAPEDAAEAGLELLRRRGVFVQALPHAEHLPLRHQICRLVPRSGTAAAASVVAAGAVAASCAAATRYRGPLHSPSPPGDRGVSQWSTVHSPMLRRGTPRQQWVQGRFQWLIEELREDACRFDPREWTRVVCRLAWKAARTLRVFCAHARPEDRTLDIRDRLKVMAVEGGSPQDSEYVCGAVVKRHLVHRDMRTEIWCPRIVLIGDQIEYEANNVLTDFRALLDSQHEDADRGAASGSVERANAAAGSSSHQGDAAQRQGQAAEAGWLEQLASRVEVMRPDVVLVERSVNLRIQRRLKREQISLATHVGRSKLERARRTTSASIVERLPSIPFPTLRKAGNTQPGGDTQRDGGQGDGAAGTAVPVVGTCELFDVRRVNGKPLMYLCGGARDRGGAIVLRGALRGTLKKMKDIVQFAAFMAHSLLLEVHYLFDVHGTLAQQALYQDRRIPIAVTAPGGPCGERGWGDADQEADNEALKTSTELISSSLCVDFALPDLVTDNKPGVWRPVAAAARSAPKPEPQRGPTFEDAAADRTSSPKSPQSYNASESEGFASRILSGDVGFSSAVESAAESDPPESAQVVQVPGATSRTEPLLSTLKSVEAASVKLIEAAPRASRLASRAGKPRWKRRRRRAAENLRLCLQNGYLDPRHHMAIMVQHTVTKIAGMPPPADLTEAARADLRSGRDQAAELGSYTERLQPGRSTPALHGSPLGQGPRVANRSGAIPASPSGGYPVSTRDLATQAVQFGHLSQKEGGDSAHDHPSMHHSVAERTGDSGVRPKDGLHMPGGFVREFKKLVIEYYRMVPADGGMTADVPLLYYLSELFHLASLASTSTGLRPPERQYSHNQGRITVTTETVRDDEFKTHSPLTWTQCKRCGVKSPQTKCSPEALHYSFGKFLESSFYNFSVRSRVCGHVLHEDAVRLFAQTVVADGGHTVNVQIKFDYERVPIYTVHFPDLDANYDSKIFGSFVDSEQRDFAEMVEEGFQAVVRALDELERERAARESALEPDLNQAALEWLAFQRNRAALERAEFAAAAAEYASFGSKMRMHLEYESDAVTALNELRYSLYCKLQDWNKDVTESGCPLVIPDDKRNSAAAPSGGRMRHFFRDRRQGHQRWSSMDITEPPGGQTERDASLQDLEHLYAAAEMLHRVAREQQLPKCLTDLGTRPAAGAPPPQEAAVVSAPELQQGIETDRTTSTGELRYRQGTMPVGVYQQVRQASGGPGGLPALAAAPAEPLSLFTVQAEWDADKERYYGHNLNSTMTASDQLSGSDSGPSSVRHRQANRSMAGPGTQPQSPQRETPPAAAIGEEPPLQAPPSTPQMRDAARLISGGLHQRLRNGPAYDDPGGALGDTERSLPQRDASGSDLHATTARKLSAASTPRSAMMRPPVACSSPGQGAMSRPVTPARPLRSPRSPAPQAAPGFQSWHSPQGSLDFDTERVEGERDTSQPGRLGGSAGLAVSTGALKLELSKQRRDDPMRRSGGSIVATPPISPRPGHSPPPYPRPASAPKLHASKTAKPTVAIPDGLGGPNVLIERQPGRNGRSVIVRVNEPTSIIAYTLCSTQHHEGASTPTNSPRSARGGGGASLRHYNVPLRAVGSPLPGGGAGATAGRRNSSSRDLRAAPLGAHTAPSLPRHSHGGVMSPVEPLASTTDADPRAGASPRAERGMSTFGQGRRRVLDSSSTAGQDGSGNSGTGWQAGDLLPQFRRSASQLSTPLQVQHATVQQAPMSPARAGTDELQAAVGQPCGSPGSSRDLARMQSAPGPPRRPAVPPAIAPVRDGEDCARTGSAGLFTPALQALQAAQVQGDGQQPHHSRWSEQHIASALNVLENEVKMRKTVVDAKEMTAGKVMRMLFSCSVLCVRQFAALRQLYCQGDESQLIASLSRCKPFVQTGGKSGCDFFWTNDQRFLLKAIRSEEIAHFESKMGARYFQYVARTVRRKVPTMLVKILGVFKITVVRKGDSSEKNWILMENLFYGKKIDRMYDLKGSRRNRFQKDSSAVQLDENLLEQLLKGEWFCMREEGREYLTMAVHNDTITLKRAEVMDYSLLLGVDLENHRLYLGIIDYMREYDFAKKAETWVKTAGGVVVGRKLQPTVVEPQLYKNRFRAAMQHYFTLMPDKGTPWVIQHKRYDSLLSYDPEQQRT